MDGDGIPNVHDKDVDGDGVPNIHDDDSHEHFGTGAPVVEEVSRAKREIPQEAAPKKPTPKKGDMDGDGIPDDEDDDRDGDGVVNSEDDDIDGDGVPNDKDSDIDGDGIPNDLDKDIDGDGVPNEHDSDRDGDGVPNEHDSDDGEADDIKPEDELLWVCITATLMGMHKIAFTLFPRKEKYQPIVVVVIILLSCFSLMINSMHAKRLLIMWQKLCLKILSASMKMLSSPWKPCINIVS